MNFGGAWADWIAVKMASVLRARGQTWGEPCEFLPFLAGADESKCQIGQPQRESGLHFWGTVACTPLGKEFMLAEGRSTVNRGSRLFWGSFPFVGACGTTEVVAFPVVALPSPQRDGAVESHASQSARRMGHPRAEARFLFWGLYAALKRRSSTVLNGFVAVGDFCRYFEVYHPSHGHPSQGFDSWLWKTLISRRERGQRIPRFARNDKVLLGG